MDLNMGFFVPLLFASFLLFSSVRSDHQRSSLDPTRVTQLLQHPRVYLYEGFLSDEECDYLIGLAEGRLEKSMVASASGKIMLNKVRTSSGMFLDNHQDEIVSQIERRLASWTFVPVEYCEPMQVLRYEHGEKYGPHYDFFTKEAEIKAMGNRFATVLMYLSNVEKGGETVFPFAQGVVSPRKNETWSECGRTGYAVKPRKGDALLFFSLNVNATRDRHSLHESCPVIEGEKWSMTRWIHTRPFGRKS